MAGKKRILGPSPPGHIVETYRFGNAIVEVADDVYRDKTSEELETIRQNALDIAYNLAVKVEMRKRGLL